MYKYKKISSSKVILFFAFSCLTLFFVFFSLLFGFSESINNSLAQSANSDAIAIRVIKNPKHYSALRWYREQGFSGSPQSTTVDGYDAVRDGRTVYVGASNIAGSILYTNIYLISFNQAAERDTRDIFGRILSHWIFNTNMVSTDFCSESNNLACLYDTNCPLDEYCLSNKAKIIRDTKRLASLADIELALDDFENDYGYYPKIKAGSYLPSKTISTWPSWQNVLAQELKMKLPIDPINKLGACSSNYHPITCWDVAQKSFADADLVDPDINLPDNSKAMVYTANDIGSQYNLCAVMESGYVSGTSSGACAGSEVINADDSVLNQPPVIVNSNFPAGHTKQEYNAYLEAVDPDNDVLTWTININPIAQWTTWSAPPNLEDTVLADHKKVWANSVGIVGNYFLTITVDDGRGGTATQSFSIEVPNNFPTISASDRTVVVGSNDLVTNPIVISVNDLDGDNITGTITGTLPIGVGPMVKINNTKFDISGIPNGSIPVTTSFPITLFMQDSHGAITSKNIVITIVNNKPIITPPVCTSSVRWKTPYSCVISAVDPDGHTIVNYTLVPGTFPAGMTIDTSGNISGNLSFLGDYDIKIFATDQYDAISDKVSFSLTVNSYCGDNIRQSLNTEHRGGPLDNGVEICDTNDGVAISPMDSAVNRQYECTTPPICQTTGACLGTCAFTGGYCGDNIVQAVHEQCETPGTGSSINDQYECNSCTWGGGWCGNGVCDANFEDFSTCADCPPRPASEFSICTTGVDQPACYPTTSIISPTIKWHFNGVQSDYCDCDGSPVLNDCPASGIPCAASHQTAFIVEIDDDPLFLSQDHKTGIISATNTFYTVAVGGLLPNTLYYFRVKAQDQYDTWGDWAECVGPFTSNSFCTTSSTSVPSIPVPPSIPTPCTDTCDSLGYCCGTHTVCGASIDCGPCSIETIYCNFDTARSSCNTSAGCLADNSLPWDDAKKLIKGTFKSKVGASCLNIISIQNNWGWEANVSPCPLYGGYEGRYKVEYR